MALILPDLIHDALTTSLSLVETALLLSNLTVVFAIAFAERRNPTVALAWVAVLPLFPHAGFALYLLFGWHICSEHRFRLKVRNDQRVRARVRRQARDLEHGTDLTLERYAARGRIVRGKESISRLLTPLL